MKIIYNESKNKSTVMTLGTFDGLHLGHQKIINLAIKRAKKLGVDSALFTFATHPLKTIAPNKVPRLLTSWKQKNKIIESLGVNQIIIKSFTSKFANLPYQEFVKSYLVDRFSVKEIIVGEDFRCGHQSKGTPKRLAGLGEEFGFKVTALPSIKINGQATGSTYIRNLVKAGRVDKVKEQLGRNFSLDCKVVKGDQRGRKLGFPTANLEPIVDYVLPPTGVYACRVILEDKTYDGVVNLGLRPTFNKEEFSVEAHIFNFDEEIYGQYLELEIIAKIRGEKKFKSKEELISRIKQDIDEVKEILNKSS